MISQQHKNLQLMEMALRSRCYFNNIIHNQPLIQPVMHITDNKYNIMLYISSWYKSDNSSRLQNLQLSWSPAFVSFSMFLNCNKRSPCMYWDPLITERICGKLGGFFQNLVLSGDFSQCESSSDCSKRLVPLNVHHDFCQEGSTSRPGQGFTDSAVPTLLALS